jgi:arsenite methyltransferase
MVAFDDRDDGYLQWLRVHHRAIEVERRAFVERLPYPADARVLDVGCGPGLFSTYLGADRRIKNVTLVDMRFDFVKMAMLCSTKGNGGVAADMGSLPFSDSSFDAVLALNVVEYSPNPLAQIEELWRVLRPGGIFVVKDEDSLRDIILPLDPDLELEVSRAWLEILRHRKGKNWDPFAGRKLGAWLETLGLSPEISGVVGYTRVGPVPTEYAEYIQRAFESYEQEYRDALDRTSFDELWRAIGLAPDGDGGLLGAAGAIFAGYEPYYVVRK